jgi:transcriptional regulator with XRE-family HTH domain
MHKAVKRDCAVSGGAAEPAMCGQWRMPKKHPIRPYLTPWRLKMNHSQQSLADELGIAHTTVGRWEAGVSGVDDATFEAISRIYGISVAELSVHPDHAEKARAMGRLFQAVKEMDAARLAKLADLAEDLRPSRE